MPPRNKVFWRVARFVTQRTGPWFGVGDGLAGALVAHTARASWHHDCVTQNIIANTTLRSFNRPSELICDISQNYFFNVNVINKRVHLWTLTWMSESFSLTIVRLSPLSPCLGSSSHIGGACWRSAKQVSLASECKPSSVKPTGLHYNNRHLTLLANIISNKDFDRYRYWIWHDIYFK